MWVGESYYPTPQDFIDECHKYGLSKKIAVTKGGAPPTLWSGRTKLYIIHPKAIELGKDRFLPRVIGYVYLNEVIYTHKKGVTDPKWVKDLAAAGQVDIVDIGPPGNGNGSSIEDFQTKEET